MSDKFDEQAARIARPLNDVSDARQVLAATLRQADANARALLAPAQVGGEAADFTDEEVREIAAFAQVRNPGDGLSPGETKAVRYVLAGDRAGFGAPFVARVDAKAAEIRARRKPAPQIIPGDASVIRDLARATVVAAQTSKPAPEPDARPMLTEWRLGGAGEVNYFRALPDDEQAARVAVDNSRRVGWWWTVYQSGTLRLAHGIEDDLDAAKRAADEAAAKWYRLPAPEAAPVESAPASCEGCGYVPCAGRGGECPGKMRAPDADGIRERAIQCAAEAAGVSAEAARDAVERSPRGEATRYVAAVERALRDVAGRADAATSREEPGLIAALRARADRLLDAGGGAGTGAEMEREINRLAREVICNVCDEMDGEAREEPAPSERAAVDRLLDIVGLTGMEEAPIHEIVAWARSFPREDAPAGVLAVVEGTVQTMQERVGAFAMVCTDSDDASIAVPRDAVSEGQRIFVAVSDRPLAGIVERDRARETYRKHVAECPETCAFFGSNGMPDPSHACAEGQRLAAAVKR